MLSHSHPRAPFPRPQALAAGMFLDGLPQMLTPLGLGGAGAADVQAGLRKTLRAVLDVQASWRRACPAWRHAFFVWALWCMVRTPAGTHTPTAGCLDHNAICQQSLLGLALTTPPEPSLLGLACPPPTTTSSTTTTTHPHTLFPCPSTPQGPIKRLAATVEQAVAEQAMYLQRARDSEVAGEWNAEVGRAGSVQCRGGAGSNKSQRPSLQAQQAVWFWEHASMLGALVGVHTWLWAGRPGAHLVTASRAQRVEPPRKLPCLMPRPGRTPPHTHTHTHTPACRCTTRRPSPQRCCRRSAAAWAACTPCSTATCAPSSPCCPPRGRAKRSTCASSCRASRRRRRGRAAATPAAPLPRLRLPQAWSDPDNASSSALMHTRTSRDLLHFFLLAAKPAAQLTDAKTAAHW